MSENDQTDLTSISETPSLRTRLYAHPTVQRALIMGAITMPLLVAAIEPVAAQNATNVTQDQACSNSLMTTVQNATLWLTFAGPSVGGLNAGYNMLKASGTNKSGKKKEYKENIRSSLIYGMGLGMLMGIINLVSSFGPMATC